MLASGDQLPSLHCRDSHLQLVFLVCHNANCEERQWCGYFMSAQHLGRISKERHSLELIKKVMAPCNWKSFQHSLNSWRKQLSLDPVAELMPVCVYRTEHTGLAVWPPGASRSGASSNVPFMLHEISSHWKQGKGIFLSSAWEEPHHPPPLSSWLRSGLVHSKQVFFNKFCSHEDRRENILFGV